MARKDEIFKTFIDHPILKEKYNLQDKDLPKSLGEGFNSNIPIIKSIAMIVQNLEMPNPVTDSSLRNMVTAYLNTTAI